jgi:hypothetical protein
MPEAESLRQIAHSRAPFSAWFGTLLLFMLFGTIVLALVGPSVRTDSYEQTRAKKRVENLKTLREADAKALNTYGWIDQSKHSTHIPIDRAMQLAVTELAQKKPAPAYPVAPAAPTASPASPQPTPAASPAASATPLPVASPSPRSATSSSNAPSPSPAARENEGPQSEIHLQPAAAANPPGTKAGTQPGAAATPHASPAPSAKPATSPSATPNQSPKIAAVGCRKSPGCLLIHC